MLEKNMKSVDVPKADLTIYLEVGHYRRKCGLHITVLSHFVLFYILKDISLLEAVRNGHTKIVRLLIENGADVNEEGEVR